MWSHSGHRAQSQAAGRGANAAINSISAGAGNFGTIISGVMGSVAQAIGQLVNNYVLLGQTGPAVLKKLLASTLASMAQEAAVKSIFQVAEGFASLAWGNVSLALKHFKLSALYAAAATAAGGVGRLVAGNSFSGGGGAGGGGNFGGPDRQQPPGDMTINRGPVIGRLGGVSSLTQILPTGLT